MKFKTSAIAIMAALPLFATAAPTGEQLQDRVFGSVFGEYYQADKDKLNSASWMGQDEGSGYGFNVGYRVNESWAIRAEVARQLHQCLRADQRDQLAKMHQLLTSV